MSEGKGKMSSINGKTKQLAILGNPVSHSFSPAMHNYISEKLGNNYVYTALEVAEGDFDAAIEGVRTLGFAGVNITSPFKFKAVEKMDILSESAKKYGSVNTCVNKNGVLYGYNTDAEGFYRSLKREGIEVCGKDILFIGAGGVTKPVMMYFAELGAKSLSIVNRTKEKAQAIADSVAEHYNYNVEIGINKPHYDIVINTTTVGMHPDINSCPVTEMPYVDEKTAVVDMIYNPEKTLFLQMAQKRGAKIINGLGMLIYQGLIAYELFCDTKLPDGIYDELLENVFNKKKNIVLTGFMASGKTTIGKLLAQKLSMNFVDTDELIEKQEGMSINEIFEKFGEEHFRKLEKELAKKLSCEMSGSVIATGGGFVLNKENIDVLKNNSVVFNLKTNPEIIKQRLADAKATRPLLKGDELSGILKRFSQREVFYKNCDAEIVLELGKEPQFYADEIIKAYKRKGVKL